MIEEKEVDGEKVLQVDTVEDFGKAFKRRLPIEAPEDVRRAWGTPDQQEDVGTLEDIIAAAHDPCGF